MAAAQGNQSLLLDLAMAPGGLTPALVETLESAGPYRHGLARAALAVGPVRLVKADVVGSDHVRLIVAATTARASRRSPSAPPKASWARPCSTARSSRRFWLAGRAKIDDWGSRPQAELHVEDAAWAD